MAMQQYPGQNPSDPYAASLENRIAILENENRHLQESLRQITSNQNNFAQWMYSLPQTGLLSKSFISRAFTVWGHYFVAQLIIGAGLLAVYLVIILLFVGALHR